MSKQKNVIIVGAGKAGKLLEADIVKRHRGLSVIGFVDDSVRRGAVIGRVADLPRLVAAHGVAEIIVAIPSADGELVRRVLMACEKNRVPVRIVPRQHYVLRHNDVQYGNVKDLDPEDFLGRSVVKRQLSALEKFYKEKTILITGGGGSIGSEIVRQLLALGARRVVIYDNSEYLGYALAQELQERRVPVKRWQLVLGNVVDRAKVLAVMGQVRPDIVFHVAAYKHVHLMEENVDEAVRVNVLGTVNVADAADELGVSRFVFVSTDKVVNPTSMMGASKNLAERYVQSLTASRTVFSIVRFGNVINSQGSVLPLFERQIREHRYVTVTDRKMKRFFMSIREAAGLVIMSAQRASRGAIYVLNMGDLISVVDVARCVVRSKNLIPGEDVEIKFIGRRKGEKLTEELFTTAERRRVKETSVPNIWQLKGMLPTAVDTTEAIDRLKGLLEGSASKGMIAGYMRKVFPSLGK